MCVYTNSRPFPPYYHRSRSYSIIARYTMSLSPTSNVDRPTPPELSESQPPSSSPTSSLAHSEALKAAIDAAPERAGTLVVQGGEGALAEETVLTPFGRRPISKVHRIPVGGRLAHVGKEIHLIDANDDVIHRAHPGDSIPRVPQASGWITYASWYYNKTSPPIKDFITTWTVPPNPATNHGQTLFLFNSIEPASFNAIIQPVLQWGPSYAGGGPHWSVASWYLVGSSTYVTSLTNVSVGASLEGVIDLTSYSGTSFNYRSYFAYIGNSLLTVTNAAELQWATETLESYGVTQNSDYPKGSTPFDSIYLWLNDNTYPSLSWSTVNDVTDGLSTTVEKNGPYNGEVTVHYPK